MDLLFKRYASPFLFLNGMIQSARFYEFVVEFERTFMEEEEEHRSWEFFLHRVMEGSYNDFLEGVKVNKQNMTMTKEKEKEIIQHSEDILNNFIPE